MLRTAILLVGLVIALSEDDIVAESFCETDDQECSAHNRLAQEVQGTHQLQLDRSEALARARLFDGRISQSGGGGQALTVVSHAVRHGLGQISVKSRRDESLHRKILTILGGKKSRRRPDAD